MDTKRSPALAAYDATIAKAKEIHKAKTGHEYGAMTWLAREIGLSSMQRLDNWSLRDGFPPEYVPKVAKLLKMRQCDVRPETIRLDMPKQTYGILNASVPHLMAGCAIIPERKPKNGKR